jgi:arylsulfatase A-like enzyme
LSLSLTFLVSGLTGCFEDSPKREGPPKRVIVISLDTLRADHLGFHGYPRPTSPNLDRLAEDGVVFERAFTNASYTLPAHMSMLTGLYPDSHGVLKHDQVLAEDRTTVAELVSGAGIESAAFVDGGLLLGKFGFARGFDTFVERKGSPFGFEFSMPKILDWLDDHADDDFFLFVHSYDVHGPYNSPKPFQGFFKDPPPGDVDPDPQKTMAFLRRFGFYAKRLNLEEVGSLSGLVNGYDDGIRYADHQVGLILDRLRSLGIYDTSSIIVTSDHGENLFDNRRYISHRYFIYDKEAQIPLIAKLVGKTSDVRRVEEFVEIVDIAATVLELFGLSSPTPLHGRGLVELVQNGKSDQPREYVAGVSPDTDSYFVRLTDWKYISRKDPEGFKNVVYEDLMCDKQWTPWGPEDLKEELYRIAEDPTESVNLAASHVDEATRARELGLQWLESQRQFNERWFSKSSTTIELSEEELEALRVLGYVGDD